MVQIHRFRLSIAASLFCLTSLTATLANADLSSASNPKSVACAQHAVIGGMAHQPTSAEIEAGLGICGVSDPVDTSPVIGAIVDQLNDVVLGQTARSVPRPQG